MTNKITTNQNTLVLQDLMKQDSSFRDDVVKTLLSDDKVNLPVEIPFVEKDKILIGPGVWNGVYFSKDEIAKAYSNTDWTDRHNSQLFNDHRDRETSQFIGEVDVASLYLDEVGNLKGDVVCYDLVSAIKLKYSKPKSGISAKVGGILDGTELKDFTFFNFSWVIDPAVKTAYINNSDSEPSKSDLNFVYTGIKKQTLNNKFNIKDKISKNLEEDNMTTNKVNNTLKTKLDKYNKFAASFSESNPNSTFDELNSAWTEYNSLSEKGLSDDEISVLQKANAIKAKLGEDTKPEDNVQDTNTEKVNDEASKNTEQVKDNVKDNNSSAQAQEKANDTNEKLENQIKELSSKIDALSKLEGKRVTKNTNNSNNRFNEKKDNVQLSSDEQILNILKKGISL